jgi:hypothetical protein
VLGSAPSGEASDVPSKFIAPSDSATRRTTAYGTQVFLVYSTNYLVDTDYAIIVDIETKVAIRELAPRMRAHSALTNFTYARMR